MALFQNLTRKTLREQRDHIMVVTHLGRITTLRIRDVLHITPHHQPGYSTIHMHTPTGLQTVLIQEAASVFQQRCLDLIEAITLEDCVLINQHYCPQRPATRSAI